jgi:Transposase DDE domain
MLPDSKAKRWIVETTFAWISRNRRLARDFERYATTVAAFIRLAMIRIMLRRLATNASSRIQSFRMGSYREYFPIHAVFKRTSIPNRRADCNVRLQKTMKQPLLGRGLVPRLGRPRRTSGTLAGKGASAAPLAPVQLGNATSLKLILRIVTCVTLHRKILK